MINEMTEIAQTYLGNLQKNTTLAGQVKTAVESKLCLEVYLSLTDSRKGRIYTQSTSGIAVGIIKSRDWSLQEGDVLATETGKLLLVHLQKQKLMVLSFNEPIVNQPIELIHLGHVLGNHHYPIIVKNNKIYLQLTGNEKIIEATIRDFQIPGLQIDYEERFANQQLSFSKQNHHH